MSAREDITREEVSPAGVSGEYALGRPAEGTLLGRYRLLRMIGEGGMGSVFEAVHEDLGRRVAIKVLRADPSEGAVARERFFREARAAARVLHPGVVQVHDIDVDRGTVFLVMELLLGETLAQRLERGPLAPGVLSTLLGPALDGLAVAHEAGVIHRDLKPGNIFLRQTPDGERAVVVDFGISRLVDERSDLTCSLALLGTPAFMSPEQCRGERDLTPASDQFALGTVLYQCLAGQRPFDGTNQLNITWKILSNQRAPLAEVAPGLPSDLVAAVERALSTDPAARFASVRDLAAALRCEPVAPAEPPRRRGGRAAFVAVGVLGLLGVLALVGARSHRTLAPPSLAVVGGRATMAVLTPTAPAESPQRPVVSLHPALAAALPPRRPSHAVVPPVRPRAVALAAPVALLSSVTAAPAVGRNRALILGR